MSATTELEVGQDGQQDETLGVLPDGVHDLKELERSRQRRILVELVRKGLKDEEIGAAVGLSRWQVRNLRYKLGIKKDRSGKLAAMHGGGSAGQGEPEGLSVQFHGILAGEKAAARLAGLRTLLLAAGEQPFRLAVSLEEVTDEQGPVDGEMAEAVAAGSA